MINVSQKAVVHAAIRKSGSRGKSVSDLSLLLWGGTRKKTSDELRAWLNEGVGTEDEPGVYEVVASTQRYRVAKEYSSSITSTPARQEDNVIEAPPVGAGFGQWKVIGGLTRDDRGARSVPVRCSCGFERVIEVFRLVTKSRRCRNCHTMKLQNHISMAIGE